MSYVVWMMLFLHGRPVTEPMVISRPFWNKDECHVRMNEVISQFIALPGTQAIIHDPKLPKGVQFVFRCDSSRVET